MPFKPSTQPAKKTPSPKKEAVPSLEEKKLSNQREVLEEELRYRKSIATIKDLIAPAAFEIQPTYVRVGSQFSRTLFVVTYPRYINVGWFAPIINHSASFDVSFFFAPLTSNVVLKQLRDKVGRVQAEIGMRQEKGKPRDPASEIALRDMERLRDELTQGTEHFFSIGLYVTMYANTLKELDKMTEDVEAVFSSKLVFTKRVLYQAEQGFNSTLPLCDDELQVYFNMNTSPAATAFPFISADLTTDNGILYGINRHNNSLILFDRFSLQNANQVVFATSGAGKSVEWSTEVLIRDHRGIRMVCIGEYIDALEQDCRFEHIDEEFDGVVNPGISVFTFNKEMKGEWSRVSVAARKAASDDLFIFHTKSGREIIVTGDHNMLVLRHGEVVAAKSHEVKKGEYIPLPTNVSIDPRASMHTSLDVFSLLIDDSRMYVQSKEFEKRIPIKKFANHLEGTDRENLKKQLKSAEICSKNGSGWKLSMEFHPSREFLRLLGYIVSEGTISNKYVIISQDDQETVADIAECLREINCPFFRRKDGSFVIVSRVFISLIHVLGAHGKSAAKRVPGFIFDLSDELIAEFLKAYFEGDGGCEQHAVSATSKSKELISDLSYLLLRFGIVTRIAARKKHATNSSAQGIYSLLTISGQNFLKQFNDSIGFVSTRKRNALKVLLGKSANTNVWTIPVQSIFQELCELFSCQFRGMQDVTEIKNGSYQPSREKLREIVVALKNHICSFRALGSDIQELASLPIMEDIVLAGDAKENNAVLWSELGQSWRLMKNGDVAPRANTIFRASSVLGWDSWTVQNVKALVKKGFQELGLHEKDFGRSFQDVLWEEHADMDYARLYHGAQAVVRSYEYYHNALDRVTTLVGKLERLTESDLMWDPIVRIEKKQSDRPYVYDLTVDNEVFLAGHGGLFVHNSYCVKLEILRTIMMGTDVIVIDPEREYQHLCDATGGTYINVSLSSQSKINPFDLPRAVGEQTTTTDILRSAVITLKGLMRLMLGKLTEEEDSIMDRALLETYAKKDITPETDLSKVEEIPSLTDLLEVLEGMEGTHSLGQRLKKYTDGTFAGLLNHPTNVELANQLVVFSVRDLEDELRPIAIYTIVNYIWNIVRSQLKRRILTIDEAWWLMQYEDSAKFIFALVKRCRKYYLGVTTITQDVNDFLTSPYGKAILTNSAIQVLLKQSPAAIDLIQRTFMLTEGEKYLLLESAPGEGIFFAGQKHVAMKVIASYSEDQLITTDPRQMLEIEAAKKEFADEKK